MSRTGHTDSKFCLLLTSFLVLSLLLAACGGGQTTTGGSDTGGTATEPTTAGETGDTGGTATETTEAGDSADAGVVASPESTEVASAGDTGGADPQATGVPSTKCEPDQKQLVWMVRNSPVENKWETDIVRPAFQKAQPDICLQILSINQEDVAVKRQAMIAAGQPLHVWSPNWGGNGFANDRAQGLLEDLTPFIEQDKFDTSVFVPDALKTYQSEGKTWGLPLLTTGSYIYYNKELFDKAGVPYPPVDWDDKSWTWEKFIATAKKLTKNTDTINKAQFGASVPVVNGNIEGPPMMWGHDIWPEGAYEAGFAEGVDLTADKSMTAYQAFHDAVYKDKVAPNPATTDALAQLGGAFPSGKLAMEFQGGWGHWVYKELMTDPNGFCWGAAPLPHGAPDAKVRAMTFTDPWVMTSNMSQEDQDIAWTFIKFLVSEEQAAAYSETTGTPPPQPRLLERYYKQFEKCMKPEDMKKVFEGAFSHGRTGSKAVMVGADELGQVWTNSLEPFFTGPNAKASDMLPRLEQQTNKTLQQVKAERQE